MSTRVLSVAEDEAEALSIALCKELARLMGLPYGADGYTGMPGRNAGTGELVPPGVGETIYAVAFDDTSSTEPGMVGIEVLTVGELDIAALEGTKVQDVTLPVGKDVEDDWFDKERADEKTVADLRR